MMTSTTYFYFFFIVVVICFHRRTNAARNGFLRNVYPIPNRYPINGDSGQPLFLTPLLKEGRLTEARNLSYVVPFLPDVYSNAGFFTVDETYNSNLFFWFFRKQQRSNNESDWQHAPVVVWLQGGPGSSSLFGLFTENGPYIVTNIAATTTTADNNTVVRRRKYSWTEEYNVLYIDNPVGSGFSFTANELGYARNQSDVANNLYAALVQFYRLYPELRHNDLYLTGESYAGKYLPALAYVIHRRRSTSKDDDHAIWKILKGLAVGNGFCDPINMIDYGRYLNRIGLLDEYQSKLFASVERRVRTLIKASRWKESGQLLDELIGNENSLFKNLTGFPLYFDYRFERAGGNSEDDAYAQFVQTAEIRKSLHVGSLPFNDGQRAYDYLADDITKSVKPLLEELLEHYPIMFYSGQVDIIVPYPLSENFYGKLSWSGASAYDAAVRKLWYVDGQLAGYYKVAGGGSGNLIEVLVRRAGHMVPTAQPKFMLDLLKSFTRGEIK